MFPEYRELISQLKTDDAHFLKIFNRHNELDHEIKNHELHFDSDSQVHDLKKMKLHLKEEIHKILKNTP